MGFLITDDPAVGIGNYPLYPENWTKAGLGHFFVFCHRRETFYIAEHGARSYFLLGHAYNPFTMQTDETDILNDIAIVDANGADAFYDKVSELTGVFLLGRVSGNEITVLLDASGMQYACYGQIGGHTYIASHIRLVGDLCGLRMDEYVQRLIAYRWYRYMLGNYLPGDLTAFSELKRIIPNTSVTISQDTAKIERFYPNRPLEMCGDESAYHRVIEEASGVMRNTMRLIADKWKRPAISLTGGIDSNTTFAAANGVYDRFTAFSYVSMPREAVDAEAAKKISCAFSVPHSVFNVPDTSGGMPDFEVYKAILAHNDGDIGPTKDDDTRKKIVLMQQCDIDVEVKSWISETIRAYAYKYFGRSKFPKVLKPRHYTALYKLFFMNRRLVRETDRRFGDYLRDTRLHEHLYNYDESDFFVWEMMHGGKCGLNIGVMKFCFDITIPYNNRKLLDLLLRVPLEDRISDRHHLDMKRLMNPALADMNIRVVNLNETERRKKMLNAYYILNTRLPF